MVNYIKESNVRISLVSNYQQPSYYYNNNIGTLRQKSRVTSDTVSFRSGYNRANILNLLSKIEQGNIKNNGQGYQSAFYKANESIGIKAPQPMYPNSPSADKIGDNNRKEFLTLNKVKEISPEIAVNPIDLIEYNNKAYLVMNVVQGAHPIEAKLTKQSLDDIAQKCFELDINGIIHSDLQNGNIFISQGEAKFIDFASNSILLNDGRYISSDEVPVNLFEDILKNQTSSAKENKFLATFYANAELHDLKNNSDNFNLKIQSNISNLEHRLIYDYIKQNKENNPKEILTNYLQSKSENYHKKMLAFLKSLEISPNDTKQMEQMQKAINTEELFVEIFEKPTEEVLKAELGKMQLKWLINDNQGNSNKAYDYLTSLQKSIKEQAGKAEGIQKKYFLHMQELLVPYKKILDDAKYKGSQLEESADLVKTIFEKGPIIQPPAGGAGTPGGGTHTSKNKKVWAIISIITAISGGAYLYNKKNKFKKTDN